MTRTIVKVQRQLSGSAPQHRASYLVYSEGRRRVSTQAVPREAAAILAERENGKAYFEGRWSDFDREWRIGNLVDDQSW